MGKLSNVFTKDGEMVVMYDEVERLRKAKPDKTIIAQRGCQEKFLASKADITIIGGNRGGSKTFSLLLEALNDIYDPNFQALIMRNERDDLTDIAATAEREIYTDFGSYNRSKDLMTWNFSNGGSLKFSYYAGSYEDFETRFRGRQFSYIAIDEITQIEYKKFKFLITCNRNAYGIRNRFIGSCNPDPDSWVRKFIDWWIGEDGLPIEERDGVVRYCFMDGDTVDTIYWGDSPMEVYEQCKHIIDKLWKPEYEALGFDKYSMFVKSVSFIRGRLEDNVALLASDPNYTANLAQQSEEARARDLEGNWDFKTVGGDRISMEDMENFFNQPIVCNDNTPYISADIAFEGGDFAVMYLWQGLHLKDIRVFTGSSVEVEEWFKANILDWGVREENVVFDCWGIGQAIAGHVPRAVKFLGTNKPQEPFDKTYKNVKSQCAEMLVHAIQNGEMSIEPRLLDVKYSGKKGKYRNTKLRDILMKERKCIKHKDTSAVGGFEVISKEAMIKAVGFSPDFFESLIYRMWFEIDRKKRHKPVGIPTYSSLSGKTTFRQGTIRKITFGRPQFKY